MGISVTVICLNEAAEIGPCLDSVRWADEIVVCDSGSTDGTREICRAYTDKVYADPWRGFSAHKNLAVDRATKEWVLSLDADERVTPELADEIQQTIRCASPLDGYTIPRRNYFLGQWIRHGGWYPDRTLRLFRRGKGRFLPRAVHEAVRVEGAVGELRAPLEHYTYRSMSAYLQRMDRYSTLAAAEMHAEGRRASVADLSLRPLVTFLRMLIWQQGFRDGTGGLVLAGLYAAQALAKYAKLWEMARTGTAAHSETDARPGGCHASGA
jgi:glycosyltransferase involved in cell wall biosynthesis